MKLKLGMLLLFSMSTAYPSVEKKLSSAISNNDIEAVRKILVETGTKRVSLSAAVETGNKDMIKYLLENGIDINGEDSKGRTGLYVACAKRFDDIALMLLRRGANPLIGASFQGNTVLHMVCDSKCPILIKEILEKVFELNKDHHFVNQLINQQNDNGESCLHVLSRNPSIPTDHKLEIIKEFFKYNGDVNLKDKRGETPFHILVTPYTHILITPYIPVLETRHIPEEDYEKIITTVLNANGDIDILTRDKESVRRSALGRGFFIDEETRKLIPLRSEEGMAKFLDLLKTEPEKLLSTPLGALNKILNMDNDVCISVIKANPKFFITLIQNKFIDERLLDKILKDINMLIALIEGNPLEFFQVIINRPEIFSSIIEKKPDVLIQALISIDPHDFIFIINNSILLNIMMSKCRRVLFRPLENMITNKPEAFIFMIKTNPQILTLIINNNFEVLSQALIMMIQTNFSEFISIIIDNDKVLYAILKKYPKALFNALTAASDEMLVTILEKKPSLPFYIINLNSEALFEITTNNPEVVAKMILNPSIAKALAAKMQNKLIIEQFKKIKDKIDRAKLIDMIRQNPYGFAKMMENGLTPKELAEEDSLQNEGCSICCEFSLVVTETKCRHIFHNSCLQEWCKEMPTCPLCRSDLREPE